jgi:hypothetical protein
MTRTVLICVAAALVCLGLTALRVTLLERLTVPDGRQVSPRPVHEPLPPAVERPIEYIAAAPRAGVAAARGTAGAPALLWAGALHEPPARDSAVRRPQ